MRGVTQIHDQSKLGALDHSLNGQFLGIIHQGRLEVRQVGTWLRPVGRMVTGVYVEHQISDNIVIQYHMTVKMVSHDHQYSIHDLSI